MRTSSTTAIPVRSPSTKFPRSPRAACPSGVARASCSTSGPTCPSSPTPITRENLQAQYDALAPGAGKLFIARFAGRPAAGIWLTHFAGTVTLKLVGWDPASRPHANDALYWTVIQTARAAGAHTLDFGGFDRRIAELIASGQPPPEGFEKTPSYFKSGFGGRLLLLPRARFAFTAPAANMAFGAVARKILTTSAALQFLQRLRNG